jgi:hypothetical protein
MHFSKVPAVFKNGTFGFGKRVKSDSNQLELKYCPTSNLSLAGGRTEHCHSELRRFLIF